MYGMFGKERFGVTASISDSMALEEARRAWPTMWHYKVVVRGLERVAEGLFKPLAAESGSFTLEPTKFIADADTLVSLGRFIGVHGTTQQIS